MIQILNLHRAVVQANSCLIKQVVNCPFIIREPLKLIPGEIAREVFLPLIQLRDTERRKVKYAPDRSPVVWLSFMFLGKH